MCSAIAAQCKQGMVAGTACFVCKVSQTKVATRSFSAVFYQNLPLCSLPSLLLILHL